MKKEILLSVLCIIILYLFTIYKIEEMTDMSGTSETPNTTEQIKEAVKQIYLADVESIRNLSNVATKLQTNGLNIPGTLTVTGNTNMTGKVLNTVADHQITCAGRQHIYGPTELYVLNKKGLIVGKEWEGNGNASIQGDLSVDGNASIQGNLSVTGATNMTGELKTQDGHTIRCAGRQHITGDRELYVLNKNGLIVGKEWEGNGNATIQGDLSVGGNTFNTKNKARYIRVGNMYSTDIPERNTGLKRTDNVSPLAVRNYWSLIEIRVLNNNGENLAKNKSVTQIYGTPHNNIGLPSNITNSVIFPDSSKPSKDNIVNGYHGGTGTHLLEIDLGNEYDIDTIELYNRYILGKDENKSSPTYDIEVTARMNGTIVELINGNKNIINRIIHTGLWHNTYSKEYIL
jgi:hypothetical protein